MPAISIERGKIRRTPMESFRGNSCAKEAARSCQHHAVRYFFLSPFAEELYNVLAKMCGRHGVAPAIICRLVCARDAVTIVSLTTNEFLTSTLPPSSTRATYKERARIGIFYESLREAVCARECSEPIDAMRELLEDDSSTTRKVNSLSSLEAVGYLGRWSMEKSLPPRPGSQREFARTALRLSNDIAAEDGWRGYGSDKTWGGANHEGGQDLTGGYSLERRHPQVQRADDHASYFDYFPAAIMVLSARSQLPTYPLTDKHWSAR